MQREMETVYRFLFESSKLCKRKCYIFNLLGEIYHCDFSIQIILGAEKKHETILVSLL
jgi:hypothetical protein